MYFIRNVYDHRKLAKKTVFNFESLVSCFCFFFKSYDVLFGCSLYSSIIFVKKTISILFDQNFLLKLSQSIKKLSRFLCIRLSTDCLGSIKICSIQFFRELYAHYIIN